MNDNDTGTSQPWLDQGNLASYFGQSDWAPYGFNGNIWQTYGLGANAESQTQYNDLTPDAKTWLDKNNYSIKGNALPGDGNYSSTLWNNITNKPTTSAYYSDSDPLFGALINLGVAGVTGGALGGGGLAGSLGMSPGWASGALNGATAGGTIAAGNQGNVLQGMAAGGVGGGLAGANPAGAMGVTNPILRTGINAATGSTLGSLVAGNDLGSSLKSGAMSGAFQGGSVAANDFVSNFWNTTFGDNQYPSGGQSYGTYPDGTPTYSSPGASVTRSLGLTPEMSYAPPQANLSAVSPYMSQANPEDGQKSAQNFSVPSGGQVGSFLSNNLGNLAQTLFGLYNNRKQQSALQSQMAGLQGLYAQNSPYAQQLRAKLQAQGAAGGTRTNTSGRETQLQAMLADKAASMAPALYQMQQGNIGLQNNQLSILDGAYNRLRPGLEQLFNPTMGSLTGPGSYNAYQNMDNMYSGLGG